ncbi:c-type cytochrome [Oxalobacteraceae bacterium OM1]|nr:c-type cytochrome [Oxalobacteraceae bacterium OM1]
MRRPFFFLSALCCALLFSTARAADEQPVDATGIAKRVAPCMACHGKEGRAAPDGYYPRIAGKPAGYLYNQLVNFREGRRKQYPLMTYMVQHLSDAYLHEMAEFFAAQHVPYPPPLRIDVSAATLERGRALAMNGDPARKVPACIACHGEKLTGVNPNIPGLLGIPRDYINAQFGAWREGMRRAVAPDCMGDIARSLSLEEISAASAWLASQPAPADPAPAASIKLPLACGSAVPPEGK